MAPVADIRGLLGLFTPPPRILGVNTPFRILGVITPEHIFRPCFDFDLISFENCLKFKQTIETELMYIDN